MQNNPQIIRLRIRNHHKLQTRRRLVIVQLVMPCPVRDEVVVRSPQLAHHVSEGEDGAEDEFGVVFGAQGVGLGSVVGEAIGLGLRGGGDGARDPFLFVDAVRYGGC